MILLFIILTGCFVGIYCYQVDILIPSQGGRLVVTGKPFTLKAQKFLMNYSFVVFSSLGTYFNRKAVNDTKLALSRENLIFSRELLFLKNQFHSHLTFNFFNFCYNRIRKNSKETAVAIEEFSDLLRYSLKYRAEELVSIQDEINYIMSYINFQKYLISDTYINFEHSGTYEGVLIIPRTLILVIETLIKKILVNDVHKPAAIWLVVLRNSIELKIKGEINRNQTDVTDLEINDIKYVFEVLYSDRYKLNVETTTGAEVQCSLIIKT